MEQTIAEFLNERDYDVRKSHNARWIDQKCTMDVLSVVADCILEYLRDDYNKEFKVKDIWFNKYTVENVQNIFKKPNPKEQARNEYDKWFGQPIKLLAYSQVILETQINGRNTYKLNNKEILEYIASRERNAHKFLCMYIEKVLKDSGMLEDFNIFLEVQDKETYKRLKDKFVKFTIDNTPIQGEVECGRIFAKVINPLAYEHNKRGSEKGRISGHKVTFDMLMYNRPNWRDEATDKPKDITRNEHEEQNEILFDEMSEYKIQKAKRQLRAYNETYRDGKSEIKEDGEYPLGAINMHHIFPKSDFPEIADYLENLIAITPNQHFVKAHPNGNTGYIDKDYQYICLVYKIGHIKENLESYELQRIYEFKDMAHVLDVGLNTDEFGKVSNMDFNKVLTLIDLKYDKA